MKTHKQITYRAHGEERTRTLCGRSSGKVWNTQTLESGQNVGSDKEVTCSYCLRIMHYRKIK